MNGKQDDRRVRKTKKALRQGLAVLMMQKNVKDITVRELADLVDIHRGTFYLHYKDVYDLQEQIENEIISEVTQILEEYKPTHVGESPRALLTALTHFVIENKEMCQALLGSNANRTFVDKLSMILQDKMLYIMAERFYTEENRAEWEYFVRFTVSGYIAAIGKWSEGDMLEPPEYVADLLSRMGMSGIGALTTN